MSKHNFPDLNSAWKGMPSTRFQGSKRKLLPLLFQILKDLNFDTCLDAFGGTGSVTHLLRNMGKKVQYNDVMPSNCMIAQALFANEPIILTINQLEEIFTRKPNIEYGNTIEDLYDEIYFLDNENRQIDTFCENIKLFTNKIAKAEAYYLLFQAMLCKRPYNLFHRANLNMRTKDVKRSFGNKATWDKPFIHHMNKFYKELAIYRDREYPSPHKVKITCNSAFDIEGDFDLIYIDTPYAKDKRHQETNYYYFYHFLDAILDYDNIPNRVLRNIKHKPIYKINKPWHLCDNILEAFEILFKKYSKSTLVISYRSDGHPTPIELMNILRDLYKTVDEIHLTDYKYVLSSRKTDTKEIAIIAQDPRARD